MKTQNILRITPDESSRIEHLVMLAARDPRVRERKTPKQLKALAYTEENLIAHYAKSKAGVFVAEVEYGLVGLGMVPLRSENGIIYVQPEYRGKGLGKGLLDAINDARENLGVQLIHPDEVFGYALPQGYVAPITGGW